MAEQSNDQASSPMIRVQVLVTIEVDPTDLNGHPGGVGEEILDMVDDIFKVGPSDHYLGLVDSEIFVPNTDPT